MQSLQNWSEPSSFPELNDEYVVDNLVLRKSGLTSGTFSIDWIGKKQVFESLG